MTLSILITYHNEREMLRECLESLQAGDVQPDEVLIYDDASNFPPAPFIPEGMQVRVLRAEKNVGPGAGRNVLLSATHCDYVHFHDSDDWFHPGWCRNIRDRLADENSDVLLTEIAASSSGLPRFENPFMNYDGLVAGRDLTAFAIERSILVPAATIRRRCAITVEGFRPGLWQSEDKDFYIRLAASGVTWAVENQPLICIRNRPDSRSRQRLEVWRDGLRCLDYASRELPVRYRPNIANAAAQCAYQLFTLGELQLMRKAFDLSRHMGGASFTWRSPGFRLAAACLGPERAEKMSFWIQCMKRWFSRSCL